MLICGQGHIQRIFLCSCREVDVDVAVYMGLIEEEVLTYESVEDMLEEQAEIFATLTDPERQTAVVNMDGKTFLIVSTSSGLRCFQ